MEGLKPPSRPREVCSDFLNGCCTSTACGFSHTGGVQRDMRAFFSAPTKSTPTMELSAPTCVQDSEPPLKRAKPAVPDESQNTTVSAANFVVFDQRREDTSHINTPKSTAAERMCGFI